uniref:Gambicin n=2 Tax=gambiae species complex TaxID=44542 RepID=B2C7H1_ANOGA|nr:gambicin [Anopheles arabiensis]ACA05598.1 gambicin [Anopheles gambiae]ACA05583.1 gambicin [Anopheles arabiensis]ACA05584.1 gambicin [Anopheles arabiensis]ACA05599.1 gambicin [Anopheles gambiae]
MKQMCILLAVLLCTAAVADAMVFAYAPTCARCKSIGARYCGYGYLNRKGVSCDGQTTINSCEDCKRKFGRCSDGFITECFL